MRARERSKPPAGSRTGPRLTPTGSSRSSLSEQTWPASNLTVNHRPNLKGAKTRVSRARGSNMFEPRVTLDQASFRALASETRIAILRALHEHPMTLTDLANRLNISKPGVMKHLDLLQEAGLVLRDPPERKWILYRLTTKGERILDPNRTRIALALGFSLVATVVGAAAAVTLATSSQGGLFPPGTAITQNALAVVPVALLFLGAL